MVCDHYYWRQLPHTMTKLKLTGSRGSHRHYTNDYTVSSSCWYIRIWKSQSRKVHRRSEAGTYSLYLLFRHLETILAIVSHNSLARQAWNFPHKWKRPVVPLFRPRKESHETVEWKKKERKETMSRMISNDMNELKKTAKRQFQFLNMFCFLLTSMLLQSVRYPFSP